MPKEDDRYQRILEQAGFLSGRERALSAWLYIHNVLATIERNHPPVIEGQMTLPDFPIVEDINGIEAELYYYERLIASGQYKGNVVSSLRVLDHDYEYRFNTITDPESSALIGGDIYVIRDGAALPSKLEIKGQIERRLGIDPYAEVLGL